MRKAALVGAMAVVASLLLVVPALASHPEVTLPGSNFEIDTDANIKVDDVGQDDWASIPQGDLTGQERRKFDSPSGSQDESFGNGTKEDTAVPSVVNGSIPPNKSDLTAFGGYLEDTGTARFLNIYWTRVQEPQGTTNMDFEFNKSETISSNGVTPVRSEGDALIQYDLSQGGTNPTLWLSHWVTSGSKSQCVAANSTPCWGNTTASGLPPRVNLTASGDATGSINTSTIPAADADGLGGPNGLSPRTFGEAQIDFDAFTGGGCVGFGSAYLKSRSSDSFTSALKDFIPPLTLNFESCGALKVSKTVKTPGSVTPQGQAGVSFAIEGQTGTFTTDTNGEICIDGLEAGDYDVTETPPAGYKAEGALTKTGTVVADGSSCSDTTYTGTTVSFTNIPLTDLTVTATAQDPGATLSTIVCEDAATNKVINVSTAVDPATGTATGLEPGTYTCTVVIDP